MPQNNILDEMEAFLIETYNILPEWARAISNTLFCSVLNENIFVYTELGPLRLNNFYLMIGPSGLSVKTTPLLNFAIPLLERVQELTDKRYIMPSRFTVEGLIEYFTDPKNRCGSIFLDELTRLFKDVKSKKHMAGILEFMSEMRDGRIFSKYTRSTGLQEPGKVFVNFLSATTPYLYRIMDYTFFLQGTGNKMSIIVDNPRSITKFEPEKYVENPFTHINTLNEKIEYFAERLVNFSKTNITALGFEHGEASVIITDYSNMHRESAWQLYKEDTFNKDYSYEVRLHEKAIKWSAMRALSNYEGFLEEERANLPIMKESVEWGIKLAEDDYRHFLTMMDSWATVARPEPATSDESDIERVKSMLRNLGGEATHEKLKKALAWVDTKRFVDTINYLIEAEEVVTFKGESGKKGGRRPMVYKSVSKK